MKKLLFPSPLEVDRFISEQLMTKRSFSNGFPSPLEVYRVISIVSHNHPTGEI